MSGVRVSSRYAQRRICFASDGKREKWEVAARILAAGKFDHMKGSPADPNRVYASQTSGCSGR